LGLSKRHDRKLTRNPTPQDIDIAMFTRKHNCRKGATWNDNKDTVQRDPKFPSQPKPGLPRFHLLEQRSRASEREMNRPHSARYSTDPEEICSRPSVVTCALTSWVCWWPLACAARGVFSGSDIMPWMPYGVLAGWHARAFSASSRAMYLFVRSERELGRSSKSRVLGRANRRASNHRAVCRSEPDHGRWRDRPPKIMVIDSV